MISSSLVLGVALSGLGLLAYFATGRKSVTALIPLFFGVAFVGLGLAETEGGVVPWVALGLAVLGFAGTARALPGLANGARGAAVMAKAAMALMCLAFVARQLAVGAL